ncbi:histidine kinase [Halobacteriales archaeon SW_7_68_16]|nr:MAG: histidine kinase [Halobacteriales archaeon SW_7_68_16]
MAFVAPRPKTQSWTGTGGVTTVVTVGIMCSDANSLGVSGDRGRQSGTGSGSETGTGNGDGDGDDTDVANRIQRLRGVTTDIRDCRSQQSVYATAVDAATAVLSFDVGVIAVVEDGEFVPRAASTDELVDAGGPLGANEGVAGRTRRDGTPIVVDDLADDPDARRTEGFRSVLSVPIGEDAVFQAFSTEVGAFDDTDTEIARLLATQVTGSLQRVGYDAALRRERDRFAAFFENVPDPAVQYRMEGNEPIAETANAAFVDVFGYEPATITGKRVDELIVPEDVTGPAPERGGERSIEGDEAEVVRETASGTGTFLLRTVPVGTERDVGYFIYTDIEAVKQRQKQLERQNERLERFTSIVSHDLRSPLTVAYGHLQLALDTDDVEPVEDAVDSLDRMDTLVDDLLTLARQGQSVGDPEQVGLDNVVVEAWSGIESDGSELRREDLRTIVADRSRLKQLFENLFRNAVEHNDDPVTTTVRGGDDVLIVEDDGVGIPPEERDDALDSGYTTADRGTGFGLAIVDEIADAHGWKTAIEDGPDGGARFRFTGVESSELTTDD